MKILYAKSYLWQAADWNKCKSYLLCVEFADKILIFAVLQRRLLQWRETEASFCFYNKKVEFAASYWPICNLSFLSKIVEKVVDARLTEHAESHRLLPTFQSTYRPFHSTETAVVSILIYMITAVDSGRIGALMLLDLSAAFDTIDDSVLLDVLYRRFGITGKALVWFDAFLSDRHQTAHFGRTASDDATLLFGVPQGYVLGPKVFSLRTLKISSADTTVTSPCIICME